MAGDWIKMEVCLPDKPEVWQIAGILGIDADSVVGKLLRVWAWFDSHTEDGNAHGVSYPLIDRVSGVIGFAEAMALCGWLTQSGTVLTIPNFARHNGKTAKNRALTNDRVAKHRKESNAQSNAASVTKTVTREEKRREEINTSVANATGVPPTDRDLVFANGVTLLTSAGVTDKNARSFLAAQCKEHGERSVLTALERCATEAPIQPVPWLQAVLKSEREHLKAPKSFRERDLDAKAAEVAKWTGGRIAAKPLGDVIEMEAIHAAKRLG